MAGPRRAWRFRNEPSYEFLTVSCSGGAKRASCSRAPFSLSIFQSTNSAFLSTSNIENLIDYTATTAIIAAGEVMVPVCGELDLSVGMVYALTPFVMCFAMAAGLPPDLAVVIALAAAGVVGLINGAVTTLLNVPAFVTTLGTMFLVNGLTLTISGGFPVEPQAAPAFAALFGGSPWARLGWALALALALALQYVLNRTRFGLHTIATGGNPIAAAEVGIRVTRQDRINRSASRRLGDHVRRDRRLVIGGSS